MFAKNYQQGAASELIANASLNSLANNALVLGSAVDFDSVFGRYLFMELEFTGSFAAAPTAGTVIDGWFISYVTVAYEDGDASITPARMPDFSIPVRPVSTGQRIGGIIIRTPVGTRKTLVRNNGTGQAFVSSGNWLVGRGLTITG